MKSKSRIIVLIVLILSLRISLAASAQTESLDELYKKAVKEEGVVNCYCSLAQINAEKIYPVFEKRFPGIKINHVDATSDKLSARAITEARGGRVIADVVEFGLEDINKIREQGLLLDRAVPESVDYPSDLKGSYWVANNLIFFVGAWNVMLAPNGTPAPIIRKVNADLRVVLADPEVITKLAANGGFVRHSTPEEVVTFVQSEQKTWRPILEQVAKEAQK